MAASERSLAAHDRTRTQLDNAVTLSIAMQRRREHASKFIVSDTLHIDGSRGEGGGQVLRTSLSLAAALGRPVVVENVRGGRRKPGLLRQHRTALRAVATISGGEVDCDELGSTRIAFTPGAVRSGSYEFGIGSAGSTMLVLQTILPPLLAADGVSHVALTGGTHNPMAPPAEFLAETFAPLVRQLGGELEIEVPRYGFFPAGGGELRATITPIGAKSKSRFELVERGAASRPTVEILTARVGDSVARREWETFQRKLRWPSDRCTITEVDETNGPGNVMIARMPFDNVTEVIAGFGQRGISGIDVARRLGSQVKRYLGVEAPVGSHLADQLMLPLTLFGGGRFVASELTEHARTNADVIDRFLPGAVSFGEGDHRAGFVVDVRDST